jgi:hypothetical protein
MNADVKQVLSRVAQWPEDDQDELAQIALEIEARRHGVYPRNSRRSTRRFRR